QDAANAEDKAKAQDARPARAAKAEGVNVKIDADNINQRILALPLPSRNYIRLVAGKAGTIFLLEGPSRGGPDAQTTLWRFELSTRKSERLMEGVNDFSVSFDGKKMLYSKGRAANRKWYISSAAAPAAGAGPASAARPDTPLNLARME